MAKLTVKGVERAKTGRHADGQGLYLLVSKTGAKSWVLRVQVSGRRRDIGLGSTAELSLAEARDKARELRKIAKCGRDPIAARNSVKVIIPTFDVAAEACHSEGPPSRWEKRHADAFIASLKQHAFPHLGRLQVDSIDENSIVAVLAPLWHEKPAAARKVRQRIKVCLDFAKVRGWRVTGATIQFRVKRTEEMGTTSAWTPERRARQAQIIRRTKPWQHATGPRTSEGKAKSSRNAMIHRDDPDRRAAYFAMQLLIKNPCTPMSPLLWADIEADRGKVDWE